ncbi:MAG: hypothetical protein GY809_04775 [Planctomycetes bacterium]|nr:hypothetical protein [Planctomycetota bacterium]
MAKTKARIGRRKKTTVELTEAEWDIIRVVWEQEPCAAGAVQEALAETRAWSYATVKLTMDRMVPNQNRPVRETVSQASAPRTNSQPVRPAQPIRTISSTAITPAPLSFWGLVFLGWLTGVTAFLGLLITKLIFIRRLIQSGHPASDRHMTILDQARTQVNYRGSARIVLTDARPCTASFDRSFSYPLS